MMGSTRTAFALAILAGLALVVVFELRDGDGVALPDTRPEPLHAGPAAAAPAQAEPRQQWVATILARPLFASDRRPQAVAIAAKPNAPASTLPRVTGILVTGDSKRVIFAGTGSGRPLVLAEGAEVNGFHVQSIEPGRITLVGPDGPRTLLPSFDQTPRAKPAPSLIPPQAAAPPALPDILPPPEPFPVPTGLPPSPSQVIGLPSNAAVANGLQIPGLPMPPAR